MYVIVITDPSVHLNDFEDKRMNDILAAMNGEEVEVYTFNL